MISNFEELNPLFEEIDRHLTSTVHFYVIGGAMLLYYGMKPVTKDIDIIVDAETEYHNALTTLKNLNFKTKVPTFEYKKVDLNQILIRDDFRIDLFHKVVCKGFKLSTTMKKRAAYIKALAHLKVWLCSKEDVLLFKTFTERDGDLTDCMALAQQKKFDWKEVLSEIDRQIALSGNKIWITWIGERLDILEERGLQIPIMKEINKLRENYFEDLETQIHKK